MEDCESVVKGKLTLKLSEGERVTIGDIVVWVSTKKNGINLTILCDKSVPIVRDSAKDKRPRPR